MRREQGWFNGAARGPMSHVAKALGMVRACYLKDDPTSDEDEFVSVALDDLERVLVEFLVCVTDLGDDAARDAFLREHGLDYLIEDVRDHALKCMRETELGGFFPEDAPSNWSE